MSTSNKENQINTQINDGRKPLAPIINKPNNTTHDQAKQPLKNNNNNNRSVLSNCEIQPIKEPIENISQLRNQLSKVNEDLKSQKNESNLQLEIKNKLLKDRDEEIEDLKSQKNESNLQLEMKNQLLKDRDEEIKDLKSQKDESNLQLEIKNKLLKDRDEEIEDLRKLINEVPYKNKKNDKIDSIQNNHRIRMIHKLTTENNELKEKKQHDHQHQNQHQHQSSTINNNYYFGEHVEHVGEC